MAYQENIRSPQEIPAEKICTKCKSPKMLAEFYENRTGKDGLNSVCKLCNNAQNRARYKANRDHVRAQQSEYYEANREQICDQRSGYRDANREQINEHNREYRTTNKEAVNARAKKYQSDNPEKIRSQRAAQNAIKSGKLVRSQSCSKCGKKCKPDAHHPSYLPEHRLDVVWLCSSCHKQIHVDETREANFEQPND